MSGRESYSQLLIKHWVNTTSKINLNKLEQSNKIQLYCIVQWKTLIGRKPDIKNILMIFAVGDVSCWG